MRPGLLARACLRGIGRYRRWGAGRASGRCRFEPSCSAFAMEALRSRAFPVAATLVVGRVLRCNPLARAHTPDPVSKRSRLRARPNAVRTVLSVAALGGLALLTTATVAFGQGVTGGCSATINGREPATMTRSNPLVVHKGESVSVQGTVPPSVASLPKDQIRSATVIDVSGIENVVGYTGETHSGTGPHWGGRVNVDRYLRWGVGLYLVQATAEGTPGWSCDGEGYVKLDGNPLTKPIGQAAAGMTGVGAVGAVLSGRPGKKRAPGPTAQEVKEDFGRDVDRIIGAEPEQPPPPPEKPGWALAPDVPSHLAVFAGCLFFLMGPIGANLVSRLHGLGNMFGMVAAGSYAGGRKRVWARGHPVPGFVFGLLLGVGATVLGQQFALWPLTIFSAIIMPIWYAITCAVFAWIGRPFRVVAKGEA